MEMSQLSGEISFWPNWTRASLSVVFRAGSLRESLRGGVGGKIALTALPCAAEVGSGGLWEWDGAK